MANVNITSNSTIPEGVSPDQIEKLARHIRVYQQSSSAVLRVRIYTGFVIVCAFLTAVLAATGNFILCIAAIALVAATWLIYFLINGVTGRSYVAGRVGRFLLGLRTGDKMLVLVGVALVIFMVMVFNLMWVCIAAAIFALGAHLTMDRVVENERRRPIEQIEQLLKEMHREGEDDRAIRQMMCEQGGADWEPLFEELFGYRAKIVARRKWGKDELGRPRRKDRPWRDALIQWMEVRMAAREEAPAQAAAPVAPAPPPEQAPPSPPPQPDQPAAPQVIVAQAPMQAGAPPAPPGQAPPPPPQAPTYDQRAAERERVREKRDRSIFGARPAWPLGFILGARVRFLIGSLLVAACLAWMQQNDLVPQQQLLDMTREVRETRTVEDLDAKRGQIAAQMDLRDKQTTELQLGDASAEVTRWFNGYGPGVAGLILIMSSLFRGAKISFFVYPAGAVAMFGQSLALPTGGMIPEQYACLVAGAAIAVVGVLFGRVRG